MTIQQALSIVQDPAALASQSPAVKEAVRLVVSELSKTMDPGKLHGDVRCNEIERKMLDNADKSQMKSQRDAWVNASHPDDVKRLLIHAYEERDDLQSQLTQAQGELAKFHEAMERERKPDWEKWRKELAAKCESGAKIGLRWVGMPTPEELSNVDRELRYMADSFTLKSNFVPAELRIKELESHLTAAHKERDELSAQCAEMREALVDSLRHTKAQGFAYPHPIIIQINKALSTSAGTGTALLARLKEAEELLDMHKRGIQSLDHEDFNRRRDAWLKEGAK